MKEKENKKYVEPINTSPHKERMCPCGCESTFIPRRRDQTYFNSNHANHAYNQGKRKQISKNQIKAEKQLRVNDKLLEKFFKYFKKNEAIVLSLNLKADGFDHSYFIGHVLMEDKLYYKSYNYLFQEYEKDGIKLTKILTPKTKIYAKR